MSDESYFPHLGPAAAPEEFGHRAGDLGAGDLGAGNPAPTIDADVVRVIEAIVLVATQPVPTDQLAQLLEQPLTVVDQLCSDLASAYDEAGHGFQFVKVAGGWRYQTASDLSPYVERFLLDGQRARMSGAALETLAIVAYKQPISRAQVASIRGVDPDAVLRTLSARGYVAQVAIDPGPGQASLFGTTPQFLEKLGLNSLSDLPPLADFVPGAEVVEALEHGLRAPGADPIHPPNGTSSLMGDDLDPFTAAHPDAGDPDPIPGIG